MVRLAHLEAKKMLKELDYLLSDLEYKNEVVSDAEGKFIGSVNEFLSVHPELKEAFENTLNERMERSIRNAEESSVPSTICIEAEKRETNPKVKRLYREIVKLTHPDKVSDARLNDIYLDAGKSYRQDDLIGMYGVCERLGIEYEVCQDDIDIINSQINSTKGRISLLESTTPWLWTFTDDESLKREIIVRYIGSQIR